MADHPNPLIPARPPKPPHFTDGLLPEYQRAG